MKFIWRRLLRPVTKFIWNEISSPACIIWAHLKAIWYLRCITYISVIVLCLIVWVQNTKKTNDFAEWTANFFGEWAMVLAATATLLLAIVAVFAIIDNRHARILDRRERLLNEIIEWAEDIRRSSSESIDPSKILFDAQPMQIASQQEFFQLRRRYQSLNTKSAYMKEAISKVFGCNLLSAVKKVIQKLDEAIEILEGCITSKAKENSEKVEKYKKSLDCCAEDLIKEATKIKTKDIG